METPAKLLNHEVVAHHALLHILVLAHEIPSVLALRLLLQRSLERGS